VIGFGSLTILRPSIIDGERDEVRLAECVGLKPSHFLAPVLPRRLRVNPAPKIASARRRSRNCVARLPL
jgi:hypothetical protein